MWEVHPEKQNWYVFMAIRSIPYTHGETFEGWRKFLCIPKAVLKELNVRA